MVKRLLDLGPSAYLHRHAGQRRHTGERVGAVVSIHHGSFSLHPWLLAIHIAKSRRLALRMEFQSTFAATYALTPDPTTPTRKIGTRIEQPTLSGPGRMLVWRWRLRQRGRRSRSTWRSRPRDECGHEHLWCGWLVAERCVWADRVVVPPPALDDDLSFSQRVEDLAIEQFISKTSIEAFDLNVLPRAARLDVGGLCSD